MGPNEREVSAAGHYLLLAAEQAIFLPDSLQDENREYLATAAEYLGLDHIAEEIRNAD